MAIDSNAPLWLETPLIRSSYLSRSLGCGVYLKLDNLQPSHSFKHRGISLYIQRALAQHGSPSKLHAIIASGGNAGLAAATASAALGVRCTVFLPHGAAQRTIDLMRGQGAEVVVHGAAYIEAVRKAEEAVKLDPQHAVMVPAYDDATLWEGHGSLVEEIARQAPRKPDAIMCSVGGAGLLGGIIVGCEKAGWSDVPLVALETKGSNCFHYSMLLNQPGAKSEFAQSLPSNVSTVAVESKDLPNMRLAHFNSFSSFASGSLGASQPSARVVEMALAHPGGVTSVTVDDALAMHAAVGFARDHKMLVEPSCAVTLAAAYQPKLFNSIVSPSPQNREAEERIVVLIVCGGFKVSAADIEEYDALLAKDKQPRAAVIGDGKVIEIIN
ncbi:tryptophan synthase beta subunit-like PLP-dependent enzyme [Cylindrobasidium torrendii FP15055 ss-10]|uniref:L-serine ammonia-lyase n=1 Tax=Cylindrobasidium torrendii FP15055 ss-10 TaxID=1314674 RepID=A0A0D7B6C7_9AGAR|nr:tryptophan synthase beta subunit-like PLP-dependent enzyme [Cylindrobasidium torrendii FP15055 ss-10]